MGALDDARKWFTENKLRAVGETPAGRCPTARRMTIIRLIMHAVQTEGCAMAMLTGTFWLTSIGGILAYQLTRPIPTSLAIIHSRVYAQVMSNLLLRETLRGSVVEMCGRSQCCAMSSGPDPGSAGSCWSGGRVRAPAHHKQGGRPCHTLADTCLHY
jgi:hypothetical protein